MAAPRHPDRYFFSDCLSRSYDSRHRGNQFLMAESEKNIELARQLRKVMEPFLEEGVYVNYLDKDEADGRVKAAYGPNYERLVAIKTKYDSTNFFRLNQNIKPKV
jgi:hypothetical protein